MLPAFVMIIVFIIQNKIETSSLSFLLSKVSSIIQSNDIKNLNIQYKENIYNKLISYEYVLKNSGLKPILKEDFESPIEISFNGELIDVIIENKDPKNIDINIIADNKNGKICIPAVLLNAGDKIFIKIFSNQEKLEFNIKSRIKGIKEIKKDIVKNINIENFTPILTLLVLSGVFVYATFQSMKLLYRRRKILKDITNHSYSFPVLSSKEDLFIWFDSNEQYFKYLDRKAFFKYIATIDSGQFLGSLEEIEMYIKDMFKRNKYYNILDPIILSTITLLFVSLTFFISISVLIPACIELFFNFML